MIKKSALILTVVTTCSLLLSGCGQNPFGSSYNSGGLKIFALFGKAMAKPKNEQDKDGAKAMATTAAAKMLAKAYGDNTVDPYEEIIADSNYVDYGIPTDGAHLIYAVKITSKPDNNNDQKLQTGVAWVSYAASGNLITHIYDWNFVGRELKIWKTPNEIDSLIIKVSFADADVNSLVPGATTLWGKNITLNIEANGDTASMAFTDVNEISGIQKGTGSFYDKINDEGKRDNLFSFDVEINHMLENYPSNKNDAYKNYDDNTAKMSFLLPRDGADDLYFSLEFTKEDSCYGKIYEGSSAGNLVVEFKRNNIDQGEYTIYDEDGNAVQTETF